MAAVLLLCVVLGIIAWLIHACDLFSREAVRLNLKIVPNPISSISDSTYWPGHPLYSYGTAYIYRKGNMAKLGDTFTATITPKNAAGDAAPVFGAVYNATGGYSITPSPDGLSAVLVAIEAGTGFVLHCDATSKHGVPLFDQFPLADVVADVDDEAVALNLAVA